WPTTAVPRKLVITINVDNLDPQPHPNSLCSEFFLYGGVTYFVSASTRTSPDPVYEYVRVDVDPSTGVNHQTTLGDADAGAFDPNGTFTITLSTDKLTQDPDIANPPNGTPPSAGSELTGVHGETRTFAGVLIVLNDS